MADEERWWCKVHNREATSVHKGRHCCAPGLGGIMIPCEAIAWDGVTPPVKAAPEPDRYAKVNGLWRSASVAMIAAAIMFLLPAGPAHAQALGIVTSGCGTGNEGNGVPYLTVDTYGRLCGSFGPSAAQTITGNAAGSTAAVVGTLAAVAGKTTFICGFNVSALGTANSVGPVTVAGLVGSSQVYQASTLATGVAQQIGQTFSPCVPASAVNTAITVTTTAAAGGTAVDVNMWGYQQ